MSQSATPTVSEITPIPLLDLKAQYATIKNEINAAVMQVIESQHFILGPEVEALEHEIAEYSQCKYGIGVSSGTDALLVALMAIDIKPGDEVITTPYTFFATVGAIARVGAKPVFVDIEPFGYNIDPTKIKAAVTEKTKAIIPVHLYGQMAEMDPIMDIAKRHNLYVIEDAAQAIGAEYKGRRAGSIGHFGCFSFFPSKNLGGFGDGGMVTANDPELAEKTKLLRGHGAKPKYYHKLVGGNFRLDALQAAVIRVKLKYLDQWTEARQRNANLYRELFAEAGLSCDPATVYCLQNGCKSWSSNCSLAEGIVLPQTLPERRHIYNQFVIRTDRRDELVQHLMNHKIGNEIYYPVPMHEQDCFAELGHGIGDFPSSECAARKTVAIPIYPELTEHELIITVNEIKAFLK
jgi:dTDP-4-amino-4,6-dideoxygalactose transaminase